MNCTHITSARISANPLVNIARPVQGQINVDLFTVQRRDAAVQTAYIVESKNWMQSAGVSKLRQKHNRARHNACFVSGQIGTWLNRQPIRVGFEGTLKIARTVKGCTFAAVALTPICFDRNALVCVVNCFRPVLRVLANICHLST